MTTVQHYLIVGVDEDSLIWEWLCDGSHGDPCRPEGRCLLIESWHGMGDHGAYRINGEPLDLITFTGRLSGNHFVEDASGTDTLTFRMQDEYMEFFVNGARVNDVHADFQQVAVIPVRTHEELYIEYFGDEDPGALWEPTGSPLRISGGDALWSVADELQWEYQGGETVEGRDAFLDAVRAAQD